MSYVKKPCYFTCTLADACAYNLTINEINLRETSGGIICKHKEFSTIPQFVEFLAKNYGDRIAVGCVTPLKNEEKSTDEILSIFFSQIRR